MPCNAVQFGETNSSSTEWRERDEEVTWTTRRSPAGRSSRLVTDYLEGDLPDPLHAAVPAAPHPVPALREVCRADAIDCGLVARDLRREHHSCRPCRASGRVRRHGARVRRRSGEILTPDRGSRRRPGAAARRHPGHVRRRYRADGTPISILVPARVVPPVVENRYMSVRSVLWSERASPAPRSPTASDAGGCDHGRRAGRGSAHQRKPGRRSRPRPDRCQADEPAGTPARTRDPRHEAGRRRRSRSPDRMDPDAGRQRAG